MPLNQWDIDDVQIDFPASEETLKFDASILHKGERVLQASNDGRGGANLYRGDRQQLNELRSTVREAVKAMSDHPALQYEVLDLWVTWKLAYEPKGVSFAEMIKGIEEQLQVHAEPLEDGVIESILEGRIQEKKKYGFIVVDQGGNVLDSFDTEQEADEFISEQGGALTKGLSIWQKQKGLNMPKKGDVIDPRVAKFGGLSSPGKMPCKSVSYKAGQPFTCPRGSKLMKVPGTVCYFCYGSDGLYSTPAVRVAQDRRFNLLMYAKRFPARQEEWIKSLVSKIGRHDFFRWHETGDIQDETHWAMMEQVMRRTPHTRHWVPTKEVDFMKSLIDEIGADALPYNTNVRVSAGWIGQRIEVPFPLTTSSVSDYTSGVIVADPGYNCPATHDKSYEGFCGNCRACWSDSVANVNYKLHLGSRMKGRHAGPEYQKWTQKKLGDLYTPEE